MAKTTASTIMDAMAMTRYYQLPPGLLGGSVGWQAG